MQIQVLMVSGEKFVYNVTKDSFIIGRSSKCDVVIAHDGVSRQHCQIDHINEQFFVTDLASTNGVLIDNVKIVPEQRTELKGFLPISFGPVQSLTITVEDPTYLKESTNSTRRINTPVREPAPQKVVLRPSGKKSINWSYYFANLMALLIFAGAVYWYVSKEPEVAPAPIEKSKDEVDF